MTPPVSSFRNIPSVPFLPLPFSPVAGGLAFPPDGDVQDLTPLFPHPPDDDGAADVENRNSMFDIEDSWFNEVH